MRKPQMIFFDYGQTLIDEIRFDADAGIRAVLENAAENPHHVSVDEIRALYDRIYENIDPVWHSAEVNQYVEVPNALFQNYLYRYFGIRLTRPAEEVEQIFEFHSHVSHPTPHLTDLLEELALQHVRTGVISNISLSGATVRKMLDTYIPSHQLDPVITSSDYIFRKPHRMIFEMALKQAGVSPSQVWFCGDNPVCDVYGASESGIFPVWYTGAVHDPGNRIPYCRYLSIRDWTQLSEKIATL